LTEPVAVKKEFKISKERVRKCVTGKEEESEESENMIKLFYKAF
jgi:hypothetical protein